MVQEDAASTDYLRSVVLEWADALVRANADKGYCNAPIYISIIIGDSILNLKPVDDDSESGSTSIVQGNHSSHSQVQPSVQGSEDAARTELNPGLVAAGAIALLAPLAVLARKQ